MKRIFFLVFFVVSASFADKCEIMFLSSIADLQLQQSKISYINDKINLNKMKHEHCLALADGNLSLIDQCYEIVEDTEKLVKSLSAPIKLIMKIEKRMSEMLDGYYCKNEK